MSSRYEKEQAKRLHAIADGAQPLYSRETEASRLKAVIYARNHMRELLALDPAKANAYATQIGFSLPELERLHTD